MWEMVELKDASAIGDGEQAAISLTPGVSQHRFWFLVGFNSVYPLERKNNPVMDWVEALFRSL